MSALVSEFLSFVNASPSPFHAVEAAAHLLKSAGFQKISETNQNDWDNIKPKGKYYFTRNQSTIMAFAVGGNYKSGNGFSIVAAHTDSPCPKVKPISHKVSCGYQQCGVELYGGGLWHTWFDRDLSVAGRVIVNENNKFVSRLVRIDNPILRIPNLAIHLNRGVNDVGFKFNKEKHLTAMLATELKAAVNNKHNNNDNDNEQPPNKKLKTENKEEDNMTKNAHSPLLIDLIAKHLNVTPNDIHDFELCLYDTQPSRVGGICNEFIFSPRLDNLMMSYCSIRSLLDSLQNQESFVNDENIRFIALFDNEEIGSRSTRGAASNMMLATLQRINGSAKTMETAIQKSFLVSADMAHAIHPNYVEKHEDKHRPEFHKGLVIKQNANQRYATTSYSAFVIRELARAHNVPIQDFVVRQDMGCGSTIGPILSTNCGIRTVDVGAPQLSMHSCREMCATDDVQHSVNIFTAFFDEFATLDKRIRIDDQ